METLISPVLAKIKEISDLFYQQKNKQGYEQLQGLLEEILFLSERLGQMAKQGLINYNHHAMMEHIHTAMEVIEEQDSVYLADVLVYDISGLLLELMEQ